VLSALPSSGVGIGELPPTPLEASGWQRLPTAAEIDAYLARLAAAPEATLLSLGRSAGGRELRGLLVSEDPAVHAGGASRPGKLRVLLVGSQHGTEPSGAEALQRVARELLGGRLRPLLGGLDLLLVPDGNPDGRDRRRRVNADGVNLSTDYVLLSQPESRAIAAALRHFAPHAVLDVHESALLKRRSLGAQGYLTDFEAQFETANHPNDDPALARYAADRFLPGLLAAVNARGLRARRYIGEITDVRQTITHGGLTLRNLRNHAGFQGALSLLVENRLDPPGTYPTPRNIEARVAKQALSIEEFLARCREEREAILVQVGAARAAARRANGVWLGARFVPDPREPRIVLPLRRRSDGSLEERSFEYHGEIATDDPLPLPEAYVVTEHQARVAELLERHAIPYRRALLPARVRAVRQRIEGLETGAGGFGAGSVQVTASERTGTATVAPGDLRIDLDAAPDPRLVALLLEPRSATGIFRTPAFADLLEEGRDFFVLRIEAPAPPEREGRDPAAEQEP
jgi:hypothetical protein